MSEETGLRKALRTLNEAIGDLTSLHVQTYTGNVDFTVPKDPENQEGERRPATNTEVLQIIKENTNMGDKTKLILVAESLYKFDGDSYNFLTSDKGIPPSALELHKSAVEGGIKTRQALMEMAKDIFGV